MMVVLTVSKTFSGDEAPWDDCENSCGLDHF